MSKIFDVVGDVLANFKGKGSWKTGVAGIAAGLATVLTMIVVPLADGNPETGVKWVEAITGVAIALGIYNARDDDKSSEDVGVK